MVGNSFRQASTDTEEASGIGKAVLCFKFILVWQRTSLGGRGLEILGSYLMSAAFYCATPTEAPLGFTCTYIHGEDVRISCLADNNDCLKRPQSVSFPS